MFRKLLIIIVVFLLVVAGLQIFGGRDFGQMSLAWDKYRSQGEIGEFMSDIGIMFRGGKVKESVFPNSRYAKMIMYRWKDELGEVHVSERKPEVEVYEEIRLGDMQFQIEEGMSKEEIKQVLTEKQQ